MHLNHLSYPTTSSPTSVFPREFEQLTKQHISKTVLTLGAKELASAGVQKLLWLCVRPHPYPFPRAVRSPSLVVAAQFACLLLTGVSWPTVLPVLVPDSITATSCASLPHPAWHHRSVRTACFLAVIRMAVLRRTSPR